MTSPITTNERKRRYFADRDVECLSCGYNLRGMVGSTCPECGERVPWPWREPISSVAWAIGLAGLVLTRAFTCGIALSAFAGNFIVGGIAFLILLSGQGSMRRWLRTRRAFGRLPRHIKQQRVAGWWLAAFITGMFCRYTWGTILSRADL